MPQPTEQPSKLRAFDIQQALWLNLSTASQLVMPNYTPAGWWECDMMSVTKAGYWSEYEIKLTTADFKADAKKARVEGWRRDPDTRKMVEVTGTTKHQELALASDRGPSFFWFILPESLKDKVQIPEWAGLMLAEPLEKRFQHGRRTVTLLPIKPAPRLHKVKIRDVVLSHARGVCYWRYWNLKTEMAKAIRREIGRAQAA